MKTLRFLMRERRNAAATGGAFSLGESSRSCLGPRMKAWRPKATAVHAALSRQISIGHIRRRISPSAVATHKQKQRGSAPPDPVSLFEEAVRAARLRRISIRVALTVVRSIAFRTSFSVGGFASEPGVCLWCVIAWLPPGTLQSMGQPSIALARIAHGTFRPIPRRFAGRRRLNVRRRAIPAHLRRLNPID